MAKLSGDLYCNGKVAYRNAKEKHRDELHALAMPWRSLVAIRNVMVKQYAVWQWNRTVKYRNAEAEQGRVMKCIVVLTKRR